MARWRPEELAVWAATDATPLRSVATTSGAFFTAPPAPAPPNPFIRTRYRPAFAHFHRCALARLWAYRAGHLAGCRFPPPLPPHTILKFFVLSVSTWYERHLACRVVGVATTRRTPCTVCRPPSRHGRIFIRVSSQWVWHSLPFASNTMRLLIAP